MQAPILKQTTPNTFVNLALALGLAASIAVNVALFTRSDDDGVPATAPQAETTLARASAADAARRQLDMERNEFLVGQKQVAVAGAGVAAQRQLSMDRADFLDWQAQFPLVRADAEQRQFSMERNEFVNWQKSTASAQ